MINKLYQLTNKSNNTILIVAKNENEAIEISLASGFVKNQNNLKIKDFTQIYLTKERKEKGLNFDNLASGVFFQKIYNNGINTWHTSLPPRLKKNNI